MAAMGVGAVIGGLMVAHRSRPSTAMLSLIGLAFGVMLLVVAVAPTEVVAIVALVSWGSAASRSSPPPNATIQLQADPAMRGRVMALYAIAFLGSTPIGAPLMGWIADISNPRVAIMVGGVATLAACVPLAVRYLRGTRRGDRGGRVRVSDAEPGEVVDFAPGPIIDTGSDGIPLESLESARPESESSGSAPGLVSRQRGRRPFLPGERPLLPRGWLPSTQATLFLACRLPSKTGVSGPLDRESTEGSPR